MADFLTSVVRCDAESSDSTVMNIDAHQHFWRYDRARDTWITDAMSTLKRDFLPEEFTTVCDANGIDASIAVQADQSEAETMFLLKLAEDNPRIAGVVGWVDFLSPWLAERLHEFSSYEKLCGFRHVAQAEPDDHFLAREDFVKGIAHLRQFGFTYDILIYPRQLPAASDLVARLPWQRFVIDHLAKPEIKAKSLSPWATHIRRIAKSPNVYCKLSGLVTEADWQHWKPEDFKPYLDVVFEAFGTERLMFGSDWPVCLLAADYAQVKQTIEAYVADYLTEDREKIFGGNAIEFYKVKTAPHGLAA